MTKLEIARKDRKIHRTTLARITGVSEATIYEAENRKKVPTVRTMQKLKAGINYLSQKKGMPTVTLDDITEEEQYHVTEQGNLEFVK